MSMPADKVRDGGTYNCFLISPRDPFQLSCLTASRATSVGPSSPDSSNGVLLWDIRTPCEDGLL